MVFYLSIEQLNLVIVLWDLEMNVSHFVDTVAPPFAPIFLFAKLLTLNMHVQIRVSNFKLQQKGFSLLSGLRIKKSGFYTLQP